jgi:hypothetical protein
MKHTDKIHKPQQKKSSWIRVLIIKKRIINPNHVPAEKQGSATCTRITYKNGAKKSDGEARGREQSELGAAKRPATWTYKPISEKGAGWDL